MNPFFVIILAGVIGTTLMTLAVSFIHDKSFTNKDMVKAVGGIFTQSEEDSFRVGLILHFIAGIFFAFGYAFLLRLLPATTPASIFSICLGAGVFHALVTNLLIIITVAESHPLRRFRKVGEVIMITYFGGHIVYAFSLGCVFSLLNFGF